MDDFTSNILNDSKNEWSILLINLITSHIIDGFRSIFNEALQLCQNNDEPDKYLMTYQNLLSRIPNWNQSIISSEKQRIIIKSKCSYLEDLVTCVHIIQLKLLSCVRVGSDNKKINISIPDFTLFLHKIYINIARKLYSNIYLFELDIPPLEQQRRNREFELLVQTSIMNTIRDNLPVEQLLRQYIDETQEVDVHKVETIVENRPINQKNQYKMNTNDFELNDQEPKINIKMNTLQEETIELPKSNIIPETEKSNTIRFHPDVNNIKNDNKIQFGNEIYEDEIKYESKDEINDELKDELNDEIKIGDEINIDLNVDNLESDNLDLDIEEIL